jgi:hypothetical protein
MKNVILSLVVWVLFLGMMGQGFAVDRVPLKRYLDYARASADWTWQHVDEIVARWKEKFDPDSEFGYRPPPQLLETAVIYAYLFRREQRPEYGRRAKRILLTYGDFREVYPDSSLWRRPDYEAGVPALTDFFRVMRYIRAYDTLKQTGLITEEEKQKIERLISVSMAYLLRTAEWGAMNRSILRAESLAWAVRAMPDQALAKTWDMQRRALADDNWGNWEIEDATIYHGFWLYALMGYADCRGQTTELFQTPEMYYYAHYFLNLMCPAGMIPDFGDARWLSNWQHFLVFFEASARQYRDPRLKWAATSIARKFIDFTAPVDVGLGCMLLDCFRWGSDDIEPAVPTGPSAEVMEDVVGKKIVFRRGWDEGSTYLLLNYRDEGDGGALFRDYLRDTIAVEEEKMTHGHADENSLCLLMSGGSVLLHDGGYRDYMPSGPFGAYRQDYFHNRLCVRLGKIWMGQQQGEYRYSVRRAVPGQPVLDFLHNAGSYRPVRTHKMDFLTFPDFDYSRTRLIDNHMGYEWDRVMTYMKEPEIFVVFDFVRSHRPEYFTLCNLWHTRKILAKGDHWYDTVYDRIQDHRLPTNRHLLILFPDTHFRLEGIEPQKRHYQDEWTIYQVAAQHFEPGDTVGLVTVLVPHDAEASPTEIVSGISLLTVEPSGHGLGVQIRRGEETMVVGVKGDLRLDMCRDFRRPRYTYEAGKTLFGNIETNADFVFAQKKGNRLNYTIVNFTKAFYKGESLYEAKSGYFGLAFDGSPDTQGVGKVRYWRDQAILNDSK